MNPADTHFQTPHLDSELAAMVLLGCLMLLLVVWFVAWLWTRFPFIFVCCLAVIAFGVVSNVVEALATAPPPHFGKVQKQPRTVGPPGHSVAPSAAARREIPPQYLSIYRAKSTARQCPGLSWTVLAGIGKVETSHGQSRLPGVHSRQNFAGAAGPMQFGNGTGKAGNSWARYGRGSVYEPENAIPAAARYLCAHGAQRNVRQAVYGYNHDWGYVATVMRHAARYG